MSARLIEASSAVIILIDAQPGFWQKMHGPQEPVFLRIEQLLMLAECTSVPVIATFEHPVETKGWLPERLERVFPPRGKRLIKRTFNMCQEALIRSELESLCAKQVVVAGAETDVCVLQSALGLLEMGLEVFVLEDCVFSSEVHSTAAWDRMLHAGVVTCTYKMLYYEITRTIEESWPTEWREKAVAFGGRLITPEDLPPRNAVA